MPAIAIPNGIWTLSSPSPSLPRLASARTPASARVLHFLGSVSE